MKKRILLLLLSLCLLFACEKKEPPEEPIACVSAEDCILCGRGEKAPWGQNNVGLVSFNTFDILPIEINRYDDGEELTAETTGTFRLRSYQSGEKGFRASLVEDPDRGYPWWGSLLGRTGRRTERKPEPFCARSVWSVFCRRGRKKQDLEPLA